MRCTSSCCVLHSLNPSSSSLHGLVKLQIASPAFPILLIPPYAHAARVPLPVLNVCYIELHRWTGLLCTLPSCRVPQSPHQRHSFSPASSCHDVLTCLLAGAIYLHDYHGGSDVAYSEQLQDHVPDPGGWYQTKPVAVTILQNNAIALPNQARPWRRQPRIAPGCRHDRQLGQCLRQSSQRLLFCIHGWCRRRHCYRQRPAPSLTALLPRTPYHESDQSLRLNLWRTLDPHPKRESQSHSRVSARCRLRRVSSRLASRH